MTASQNIARLIPTGLALSILGNTMPHRKRKKKLVKTGIETIVGLSFLPTTAQLAGSI